MFDYLSVDPHFQGIKIKAPSKVLLERIPKGQFIWESRSSAEEFTYSGELYLEGVFAVYVPCGEQTAIWENFSNRIQFTVTDRNSGSVQQRSRVTGGWDLARQGISVTMVPMPSPSPRDYSQMACDTIERTTFNIDVFDNLVSMPEPGTTLEIFAEYMGFRSNSINVRTLLKSRP